MSNKKSNKILLAPADYVKTLIKYPVLSLIWIIWVGAFLLLVLAQVSPGVQNGLNNAAKTVGIALVTDTLSSAAESNSDELAENATKLQIALDENDKLKAEYATVTKQLNEALDLLTDLEKNDQSSQSENTQLAKKNKTLSSELSATQGKLATAQTTLANIEQKYQLTLMENKNLLQESQLTKESLNKAETQISALQTQIDKLKQTASAASNISVTPNATDSSEVPATTATPNAAEEVIEPSSLDAVSEAETVPNDSTEAPAENNTDSEAANIAPVATENSTETTSLESAEATNTVSE